VPTKNHPFEFLVGEIYTKILSGIEICAIEKEAK